MYIYATLRKRIASFLSFTPPVVLPPPPHSGRAIVTPLISRDVNQDLFLQDQDKTKTSGSKTKIKTKTSGSKTKTKTSAGKTKTKTKTSAGKTKTKAKTSCDKTKTKTKTCYLTDEF